MIKKGVSAIVRADNGSNYFLILHRNKNWTGWEFPKGGIEDGETPEQTLARELKEETGLAKVVVKKKMDTKREFTANNVLHSFDVYLCEANMNHLVKVDKKVHDNFLWASSQRVLELLRWENEKEIFKEALEDIKLG